MKQNAQKKLNKHQKRNWVFLITFSIFIFGVIVYSNFSKYIEYNSFYTLKNSLVTILKILFGIATNIWFLVVALFILVLLFAGLSIFCQRILNFIPIVRNKFLKLFFLKFIYGKSIAKKFISENKKEIIKIQQFKKFNDKQTIDLFKSILVLSYEEAVEPSQFNFEHGGLKKPDDNYFRDPNLTDLKFNFIKMSEVYASDLQNEKIQ